MSRGHRGRKGHTPYRGPVPAEPCPDCAADAQLIEVAPGVLVVRVHHDPTCPWLSQQEASR